MVLYAKHYEKAGDARINVDKTSINKIGRIMRGYIYEASSKMCPYSNYITNNN